MTQSESNSMRSSMPSKPQPKRRAQPATRSDDDLCYLSAGEALSLFARKKLSPVELMQAVIARAERVNPAINCFADRYFGEALEKAKASEARYMKRGARSAFRRAAAAA
jgi:hypothetical protein